MLSLICLAVAFLLSSVHAGEYDECDFVRDLSPSKQCQFVKDTPDCNIDSGYFNYIEALYCEFNGDLEWAGYVVFGLWFAYLLLAIGSISDAIFIPNLTTIAKSLRMSEATAGETLLPFGNGAADIFTALAASLSMNDGDVSVMYGCLLGSGLFTTTVIVAGVVLVRPFHTMQRPLLRTMIFYLITIFVAWLVVYDGIISIWEAIVFLIIYVIYLLTIIFGPKLNAYLLRKSAEKHHKEKATTAIETVDKGIGLDELPPVPEFISIPNKPVPPQIIVEDVDSKPKKKRKADDQSVSSFNSRSDRSSNLASGSEILELPPFRQKAYSIGHQLKPGVASGINRSNTDVVARNRSSSAAVDNRFEIEVDNNEEEGHQVHIFDPTFSRIQRMMIRQGSIRQQQHLRQRHLQDSLASLPKGSSGLSYWEKILLPYSSSDSSSSEDEQTAPAHSEKAKAKKAKQFIIRRQVDTHSSLRYNKEEAAKRIRANSINVTTPIESKDFTFPTEVAEAATKVESEKGEEAAKTIDELASNAIDMEYYKKPLWKILLDGLNPINKNEWEAENWFWRVIQILKAPIIFSINLTTPIVDEERPLRGWNKPLNSLHCLTSPVFMVVALNFFSVMIADVFPLIALFAIVGLVFAVVVFFHSKVDQPPFYMGAFGFLGFFTTVMWIYITANEVVNLIYCFGLGLGISQSILGVTVLAWGNSIADFTNNFAVAREGYSKMAISSCFASQMFNMLLGLGAPLTIVTIAGGGSIRAELPPVLQMCFLFLIFFTALSYIAIPLVMRFYVRRPYGIILLVGYAATLVTVLLVEVDVIPIGK